MSTVDGHETASVPRLRPGPAAVERLGQFPADSEIEIVAFDEVQVRAAAAPRLARPRLRRYTRASAGV